MKLAIKNLFGIRFKLVFLSSFLLVIPWLGYRYILEMEEYLQLGQEQTVLGTAQALATALNVMGEIKGLEFANKNKLKVIYIKKEDESVSYKTSKFF